MAEAKNAVYSITFAEIHTSHSLNSYYGPDAALNYKFIINLDPLC